MWTSPLLSLASESAVLPDPIDAISVVPASIGGLIVPSILAALPAPNVVSYDQKQIFMSIWQWFPLWSGMLHYAFKTIMPAALPAFADWNRKDPRQALRVVYAFGFLGVFLLRFSSTSLLTATIFPALFASKYASQLSFLRVSFPATALHTTKMASASDSVLLLLQWDQLIGTGVVLLWASILLLSARKQAGLSTDWILFPLTITGATLLTGASGCAVAVMWARDELVLSQTKNKKTR